MDDYSEFLDRVHNTFTESTDNGGVRDIRDRKAKQFLRDNGPIYLDPPTFAGAYSRQIGVVDFDAVDELERADRNGRLVEEIVEQKERHGLALVVMPDSSGQQALDLLLTPELLPMTADTILRVAQILVQARQDHARGFEIYLP